MDSRGCRKATLEAERRTIVDFLVARFDSEAESAAEGLEKIDDQATLKKLVGVAARCPDLDTFLKELGEFTSRAEPFTKRARGSDAMIDPGVLEELTALWRRIVTLDIYAE